MHSHSLSDVVIFISAYDCCNVFTWDTTTVIKPNPAGLAGRPGIRPAWQVDLGSGRPGGWTGPGLIKDRL